MKNLRRIVWSKGMFLTPQHFQAQENYLEDTLHFRFATSNFANWGVTDLAIDEAAVANGHFVLIRCRGVLPDGALLNCPAGDDLPAGRPFNALFPPTQDSLDVYIALPERRPQGRNVVEEQDLSGEVNVRYRSHAVQVRDENGGEEEKLVEFAGKNLQILFGGQRLDGFTQMRIAQIVRDPAGLYTLKADFVPACLSLAASPYLMGLLKRQIEVLGTKSQALSNQRRQRSKSAADFNTSENTAFWLLNTVNSFLPELKHVWSVRRGHPEPVYLALLRLAGALTTFSMDADPRSLPDYDHENLGPTFTALDRQIRDLVETVLPSKCISIQLRQTSDRFVWTGQISDDRWLRESQFLLAITAQIGMEEVIRKIPQLVKVAAPDDLPALNRRALPGLTLRHLPSPPSSVPYRVGTQYFALNQAGQLWESIASARNISLFIPSDITAAQPELLVLLS